MGRAGEEVAACFAYVLDDGCFVFADFGPEGLCAEAVAEDEGGACYEGGIEGEDGG